MYKSLIFILVLLSGCSSTQMVYQWKNPDTVLFHAEKVLIVGMTQNYEAREHFETNLQKEFTKRGVESMRSIDLFDVKFTQSEKTELEIKRVEQQLLDKDFDAILFTKVIGYQSGEKVRNGLAALNNYNTRFRDDYRRHQEIFYDVDYYNKYTVYQSESSLFCICVDKDQELIWKGAIEVTDPVNIQKAINDYIKLVVTSMEEQDLVFRKVMK